MGGLTGSWFRDSHCNSSDREKGRYHVVQCMVYIVQYPHKAFYMYFYDATKVDCYAIYFALRPEITGVLISGLIFTAKKIIENS